MDDILRNVFIDGLTILIKFNNLRRRKIFSFDLMFWGNSHFWHLAYFHRLRSLELLHLLQILVILNPLIISRSLTFLINTLRNLSHLYTVNTGKTSNRLLTG